MGYDVEVPDSEIVDISPAYVGDVFRWPEFKALATRLGIDLSRPTRHLIISIPYDDAVQITHEYLGVDNADKALTQPEASGNTLS